MLRTSGRPTRAAVLRLGRALSDGKPEWMAAAEREAQGSRRVAVRGGGAQARGEIAMSQRGKLGAASGPSAEPSVTEYEQDIRTMAQLLPEATAPSTFFSHNDGSAAKRYRVFWKRAAATRRALEAHAGEGARGLTDLPQPLPP